MRDSRQLEVGKLFSTQWFAIIAMDALVVGLLALATKPWRARWDTRGRLAMVVLLWLAAAMAVQLWLVYYSYGWVEFAVAEAMLIILCAGMWYLLSDTRRRPLMPPDIAEIWHDRPFTDQWLRETLRRESAPIHIDAMGVKQATVYNAINTLEAVAKVLEGKQVNVRVLFLKCGSAGVQTRADMEDSATVHKDVEAYQEHWARLVQDAQTSKLLSLDVREFEFSPPLFIIRVGDQMLVNPYLATHGYNTMTMLLKRGNEEGVFRQYEEFFERVWDESSGLSTELQAAAPAASVSDD